MIRVNFVRTQTIYFHDQMPDDRWPRLCSMVLNIWIYWHSNYSHTPTTVKKSEINRSEGDLWYVLLQYHMVSKYQEIWSSPLCVYLWLHVNPGSKITTTQAILFVARYLIHNCFVCPIIIAFAFWLFGGEGSQLRHSQINHQQHHHYDIAVHSSERWPKSGRARVPFKFYRGNVELEGRKPPLFVTRCICKRRRSGWHPRIPSCCWRR